MTIRELIDRLKTAENPDSDIYIVRKFDGDTSIVANPIKSVFCTNDGTFLEHYKEGEITAPGDTVQTVLCPDRSKDNV